MPLYLTSRSCHITFPSWPSMLWHAFYLKIQLPHTISCFEMLVYLTSRSFHITSSSWPPSFLLWDLVITYRAILSKMQLPAHINGCLRYCCLQFLPLFWGGVARCLIVRNSLSRKHAGYQAQVCSWETMQNIVNALFFPTNRIQILNNNQIIRKKILDL